MPSPTSSTSSSTDSASPPASESAKGSGPQRRRAGGEACPVERCELPARAALLEQRQAAERVEGEVLQELADRVRPEHGPIGPRRQFVSIGRPPRDLGG